MKKLLLATLLMAIHFGGNAQTLPLDIAAMRAVVAGDFACTTFHCRTKTIEAYEADTLYGLLYRTASSVASSGDLNAVCNLGNVTNTSILSRISGGGVIEIDDTTTGAYAAITPGFYSSRAVGSPFRYNVVTPIASAAGRAVILPDEGNGVGWASTLVAHLTKDSIEVSNGGGTNSVLEFNYLAFNNPSGLRGVYSYNQATMTNTLGDIASLRLISGTPILEYTQGISGFNSAQLWVAPTANRQQYFPDEGSSSDIPGSTFVTHTTKDSIRVGIASTDFSVVDKARQYHQNIGYQTGFGATALYHQKLSTGFTTLITFIDPTVNRNVIVPDEDGVIALLNDTVSGSGIGRLLTPTSQSNGVVFRDRKTAQTASVNLATYTVGGSDESLEVSANVLVTTATLHNFNVTCTYTDEGGTSRTLTMPFSSLAGAVITAIANAGGTVPSEGVPLHVRAKSGTTVIIGSTGTFTTVTYNIEGVIKKY